MSAEAVTARHAVLWDAEGTVPEEVQHLDITGKSFVLGVGCRRGVEPLELRLIAEGHLSDLGLRPGHIAAIASCDVKADEPAILELGEKWQVPVEFHAAAPGSCARRSPNTFQPKRYLTISNTSIRAT